MAYVPLPRVFPTLYCGHEGEMRAGIERSGVLVRYLGGDDLWGRHDVRVFCPWSRLSASQRNSLDGISLLGRNWFHKHIPGVRYMDGCRDRIGRPKMSEGPFTFACHSFPNPQEADAEPHM